MLVRIAQWMRRHILERASAGNVSQHSWRANVIRSDSLGCSARRSGPSSRLSTARPRRYTIQHQGRKLIARRHSCRAQEKPPPSLSPCLQMFDYFAVSSQEAIEAQMDVQRLQKGIGRGQGTM